MIADEESRPVDVEGVAVERSTSDGSEVTVPLADGKFGRTCEGDVTCGEEGDVGVDLCLICLLYTSDAADE